MQGDRTRPVGPSVFNTHTETHTPATRPTLYIRITIISTRMNNQRQLTVRGRREVNKVNRQPRGRQRHRRPSGHHIYKVTRSPYLAGQHIYKGDMRSPHLAGQHIQESHQTNISTRVTPDQPTRKNPCGQEGLRPERVGQRHQQSLPLHPLAVDVKDDSLLAR